jgi:hypothetical protein
VGIRQNQILDIVDYEDIVQNYALETMLDSHERWVGLLEFFRERDPTTYPLFNLALAMVEFYVKSMRRNGIRWLGMRFHFPSSGALPEPTRHHHIGKSSQKLQSGVE